MNTVLILGANGRFGQAATQAFAAAGWRVLAQLRRAPTQALPPGAVAVAVPLADTADLVAQAVGTSTVVHAINPIYTRWDQEAMPALHQGLAVAQGLKALFMLPGNVYNFGAGMPALLREDTPQAAGHAKGRLRREMEHTLRDRADQGLRSVVIRAGDFFGGGTGSWLDRSSSSPSPAASCSTPARWTACTPGPTCPTWRAPSRPWRRGRRSPPSRTFTSPATP